ncbi:DEAD/DEAH box helicase [Zunongwangia endophytica]|uniref:DEAD/DEAH box helicase n=1 Tax=Zunongwangia endophytica TaxID=1808945 RepID=A0ABV8H4Z9_9FLAO|nr:DEAD/DEAH box helicase [Zunongwangia endophytica]MDN3596213.1 DEAD/DEAH box helicase [Zunongwangia endophytica]
MTFKELGVIDPILKALEEKGYSEPTPIQQQAIPVLLKGKDLLGSAQTGTGKTAAFTIPILQSLVEGFPPKGKRKIRALIITPTRELAIQIAENIDTYSKYTGIRNTVIFGGVKQHQQVRKLQSGVDILTATPGRLLDLISQNFISLSNIDHFVLDEADQMLDMGFVHEIKKILKKLPKERQSLFFSATMPKSIIDLSKQILGDFERVNIAPKKTTAERVDQAVYFVPKQNKVKLLVHLLETEPFDTVLIFSRTKHGANKIVKKLSQSGLQSAAIHGNKSQNQRQNVLNDFKDGKIKVLVATDIAARGIDVSQLSLVVQFDLPNVAETYVHRIGRTGRAKASGSAIAFCDTEERPYLKSIEKLTGQRLPVIDNHDFKEVSAEAKAAQGAGKTQNKPRNNSRRNKKSKPKR